MEFVIGLIVIVALLLLFRTSKKSSSWARPLAEPKERRVPQKLPSQTQPTGTKEEQILEENMVWLREKWELANKEREAGEIKTVPNWFFDDVTERQLRKLEEIGGTIKGGRPTKGQASDMIVYSNLSKKKTKKSSSSSRFP